MRPRTIAVLAGLLVVVICMGFVGRTIMGAKDPGPAAAKPVPPPEACVHEPSGTLCPTLPQDIPDDFGLGYGSLAAATQRPFDNFSWQMFVALNWPANSDGTPAPGPIGAAPDAPRVWEFYPSPFSLFEEGLAGENRVPPALLQKKAGGRPRRFFSLLSTKSNPPDLSPASFLQAGSNAPLIDRNLNFVVYDIAINQTEYDYIQGYQLNTKRGQQAFQQQGKQVSFPQGFYQDPTMKAGGKVGAIEIKTAWRILDPNKGDRPDRFYHVDGTIYVDAEHSETGQPMSIPAKLGLVGFHVIQRTTGPPHNDADWIWSTFEHLDNAPLADNARDPDDTKLPLPTSATPPKAVARSYSFFDPNNGGMTNTPPPLPQGETAYKWAALPPYAARYATQGRFGTQVVRCWKIFPATADVNAYFQGLLKGTVWANYQLIGTQWMGHVDGPPNPELNGNIPRYLANTTVETYLQFNQNGSCLGCHGYAQTTVAGQSANFSFLLMRAR